MWRKAGGERLQAAGCTWEISGAGWTAAPQTPLPGPWGPYGSVTEGCVVGSVLIWPGLPFHGLASEQREHRAGLRTSAGACGRTGLRWPQGAREGLQLPWLLVPGHQQRRGSDHLMAAGLFQHWKCWEPSNTGKVE